MSQISDEITVCPYCMDKKGAGAIGCCGESRAHFVKAYDLGDETVLADEVEVKDEQS